MRLIPLLLVSVSLVLAGCSKEEDPGDGDNTTTTTTSSTPPTGTTTTTTTPPTGSGNNTGGNTTTRAPMELCNKVATFTPDQMGAPTPPATAPVRTEACGTPGVGYTKVNATVTWEAATPVPASASPANPTVTLVDSAGTAVGSCAGPTGPVEAGATCAIAEAAVVAGEYALRYEGTGNLRATVSVMVS